MKNSRNLCSSIEQLESDGRKPELTLTNLVLPFSQWMVLGVASEFAPALYFFRDEKVRNGPQRSYCTRSP